MVLNHRELISNLRSDNACMPALMRARNMTVSELLNLYVKNIDYSIKSKLLTPEFLKSNAATSELSYAGISIDCSGSIINPGTLVLLGRGKVRLLHHDYNVSRIYCAQSVQIVVDAAHNSNVVIEAYDNAHVEIHQYDSANVTVILNDSATCNHKGRVKIKNK